MKSLFVPLSACDHPLALNQNNYVRLFVSNFHCTAFSIELIKGNEDNPSHYLRRHFSELYLTDSQSQAHFLRHSNGRPHVTQTFGANPFFA
jgi:hypothetical protein